MSKSRPEENPERRTPDAATQLTLLLDWLKTQLHSELPKLRRQVDPLQGSREYQVQLQDLNTRERIYEEILQRVEELRSGSNPNRTADFMGADELPPILEMGE